MGGADSGAAGVRASECVVRFAQHTLVITRGTDVERRRRFEAETSRAIFGAWSFFDGFDGPSMWLETGRPSTAGRDKRPAPDPLCAAEIGCLLSHAAIWRTAHALGIERLCVIEDDVELLEQDLWAWDLFERSLPPDWLMVHGAQDHVIEPEPINAHVARVRHSYGTHFMVLTREAIGILARLPVTMTEPADWVIRPLFETGRVYCPRLSFIRHRNDPGGMP